MIPWIWISNAISQAVSSIIDGRNYVGKTLMPTEILVMVPVLSNGVNFLITIVLLFPVSFAFGVPIWWALLFLPLLGDDRTDHDARIFLLRRDRKRLLSRHAADRGVRAAGSLLSHADFLRALRRAADLQFLVKWSPVAALISRLSRCFLLRRSAELARSAFAGAFSVVLLFLALVYFNRHRDALGEYV